MSDVNGVTVSVNALLKKVCEKESIENPEYEFSKTTLKGDGYMGVVDAVKIRSNGKEFLSVITKTTPENNMIHAQMNIKTMYQNETFFYDELYPTFKKFQMEKCVDQPFDCVPRCYATSMEDGQEGLVLENLKDKGYMLWNRMLPMNEEHIILTIKTYAKLHALSFVLKYQRREDFEYFRGKLVDVHEEFSKIPGQAEAFQGMVQSMLTLLDPETDKVHLDKFSNYLKHVMDNADKFLSKSMDEYSVLLHGDCWCNNMMYKYEDSSNPKKPTGMCLIDFQVLRYGSPIIDFVHFFYTASPKSIMDDYTTYLNIYYDCLCDFIKRLGGDPEKLYPRTVFDSHWKKYCTYGLQVALFMIKIITTESDETPDFTQVSDAESMFEVMGYEPTNADYKRRIRDVIVHFSENNLI